MLSVCDTSYQKVKECTEYTLHKTFRFDNINISDRHPAQEHRLRSTEYHENSQQVFAAYLPEHAVIHRDPSRLMSSQGRSLLQRWYNKINNTWPWYLLVYRHTLVVCSLNPRVSHFTHQNSAAGLVQPSTVFKGCPTISALNFHMESPGSRGTDPISATAVTLVTLYTVARHN